MIIVPCTALALLIISRFRIPPYLHLEILSFPQPPYLARSHKKPWSELTVYLLWNLRNMYHIFLVNVFGMLLLHTKDFYYKMYVIFKKLSKIPFFLSSHLDIYTTEISFPFFCKILAQMSRFGMYRKCWLFMIAPKIALTRFLFFSTPVNTTKYNIEKQSTLNLLRVHQALQIGVSFLTIFLFD